MADIINITEVPQRVTAASVPYIANPWAARDVSGYTNLNLELSVVAWESPTSPSLTIEILSGFQRETKLDWISGSSKTLTLAAPRQTLSNDFLTYLRYVSWKVTALSGATSALIWIRGMARR